MLVYQRVSKKHVVVCSSWFPNIPKWQIWRRRLKVLPIRAPRLPQIPQIPVDIGFFCQFNYLFGSGYWTLLLGAGKKTGGRAVVCIILYYIYICRRYRYMPINASVEFEYSLNVGRRNHNWYKSMSCLYWFIAELLGCVCLDSHQPIQAIPLVLGDWRNDP